MANFTGWRADPLTAKEKVGAAFKIGERGLQWGIKLLGHRNRADQIVERVRHKPRRVGRRVLTQAAAGQVQVQADAVILAISFTDSSGHTFARKGEFVATAAGVEGSLIYAASGVLRDEIAAQGSATFLLDLLPDRSLEKVLAEVNHPRGSRSLSSHLKSRLGLEGIKSTVLHEGLSKDDFNQPHKLAAAIKALPITLSAPRPIDEAISSAGGVMFEELDPQLMLTKLPGVFCAGEMLDWEAPTGGYLLTASLASGRQAGQGVVNYLKKPHRLGRSS